ncbi:MAG TPA: DUF1444 family protein [Verrucomicrobiae bacterium]
MLRRFFTRKQDAKDFRDRVINAAARLFPDLLITASPTQEEVINAKGVQLGLQNLETKFNLSDRSEKTLEELVREHFAVALNAEPAIPDFEAARPLLRPQIMPPNFATQAPIVSYPFGGTLAIGIVFDDAKSYSYIRREDAEKWAIPDGDLLQAAIASFDEAIRGKTKMHFSEKENTKWLGVETKDGFDAARILIPGFQKFLSGRLGNPFRFGVPNRDLLICWNCKADESFVDFATSKIREDFEQQPYPLSPNVFEMRPDFTIVELIP